MAGAARNLQGVSAQGGGIPPFRANLFDVLPFPAALLDASGHILAVNGRWQDSRIPLLADHLPEGANFFQTAARLRLFAEDPQALQSLLEVVGGVRDGSLAVLRAERIRLHAAAILEDQLRGLLLMIESATDPTPSPDPDSKAHQLESLTALAGGVAHDFNNLLTTMLGYTHLALADLPPGSSVRDFLLQVEKSARRAADLTQQLLSYAGRNLAPFQRVQLNQVIWEMRPLLESVVGRNTLHFSLAELLPAIEGDPLQLRQVVMNLATNAAEAFEDSSGTVSIRTGTLKLDHPWSYSVFASGDLSAGPYVYLEVEDTGRGMTPETVSRLFHPFFSTKFTGRGLGMAAVWGIIRSHRGLIKVESAPGKGSVFRVLIPASSR